MMAVDVIWCLIDLSIIALIGYAATSAIVGRERRCVVEIAGLTLLLGAGATSSLLILLSIIGIATTRWLILLLGVASIVAILALWRWQRASVPMLPRFKAPAWETWLILIVPILLLLGVNLISTTIAVSFDYFEWDSAVIWGFKAKVLYDQPLLWHSPQYFHDVRLSYSHLDYPLLWPMLIANVYAALGHASEQLGKFALLPLIAGQSLLAYSGARLWLGRFASLMLAIMLVGSPFAIVHAALGSADFPLTAFDLGAVVYLIRWIMYRHRSDIILAALFSGFVASTKVEGLPLAVIYIAVVFAVVLFTRPTRDWKDFATFAAIVIGFIGFWIIWRIGIPHTHDDYASRLSPSIIAANPGRITMVLKSWKDAFLSARDFGWLWISVPIIAALGYRAFATTESLVLWALLVLHLSLYMLAYMITDWNLKELLSVTSQRLLLHVTPLAIMLLAVHWSAAGRFWRNAG